jgi:light-regulated signal transduction histidine kinase (bacteriophytochrome)
MDRQIRKLNAELEEKVQERTRELEAANKELEAFSYSVSHDLRAPIRHITGFSEILASDHASRLDPDGEECVRHILEAANHMSVMTDGLLKLAQVSRQPLIMENTSLNLLVELAVRELSAETEGRRIEWKVGVLPSVACDPGLMEQVFANLIGNAVKYTRHREVATIEIGQILVHGEPVIFVADNGAGFDMRYADKLFGAFQRLHDRKEFEGTGVGLSTVQRIIQKQGGRIWAESAPDHGARFSFTLSTSVAQRAGRILNRPKSPPVLSLQTRLAKH